MQSKISEFIENVSSIQPPVRLIKQKKSDSSSWNQSVSCITKLCEDQEKNIYCRLLSFSSILCCHCSQVKLIIMELSLEWWDQFFYFVFPQKYFNYILTKEKGLIKFKLFYRNVRSYQSWRTTVLLLCMTYDLNCFS